MTQLWADKGRQRDRDRKRADAAHRKRIARSAGKTRRAARKIRDWW